MSRAVGGVPNPNGLTISDGVAEAVVVPELGAGVAAYDLVGASGRTALFRPCREPSRAAPFDLALNLLVPWSNRISGGGFHFGGQFHALAPNLARRAVSDPRQWLLKPLGTRARHGRQRRTLAPVQGSRPLPLRSACDLFAGRRRARRSALGSQSRAHSAAVRPRLSSLDRARRRDAAQGEGRARRPGDGRTFARRRSARSPRAPSGTSPRAARFPPAGSTTPSSAGTVARQSSGPSGNWRLTSRPRRRLAPTSSIHPRTRPTSSVSSRSPIRSTRITCRAVPRPMA